MLEKKQRRAPRVGSKYQRLFKHVFLTMEVVKHQGGIGYRVNGVVYPSPSSAAKAVTNTSVNGWEFWGIDKCAK